MPFQRTLLALLPLLPLCALSCASSEDDAPEDASAQIARGGRVFSANCAECHGVSGQGTDEAPPLVGPGALPREPRPGQERNRTFFTALDVAGFVTQNMPPYPDERERIPESDYWAVLAFALDANGIDLKEPLGPHNAARIVLHP